MKADKLKNKARITKYKTGFSFFVLSIKYFALGDRRTKKSDIKKTITTGMRNSNKISVTAPSFHSERSTILFFV